MYHFFRYIVRYANPNLLSIGIYEYSLTSIWSSITFIEKISQNSLTINAEEYDAKIIEMTKMEESNNYNSSSSIQPSNSTGSNSGGIIKSVMGLFQSVMGNESSTSNTDGDIPYQGIFRHLDSVNSVNSINRKESSLSSNSILVNDYIKELREKYFSGSSEPVAKPFDDSTLSEEERKKLMEVDKELKASLSISSNKGDERKK
ncbi:hypothetical protein LY90DRAFT_508690 [Neocallimastix californiae]|uniref:VPS9 domain-containing protein n=1 Tax=Neocallimastix californiae TaxID=1754190 RepID=A0A1Y2CQJ5_9FUNG|nr:hypothetical protein LY90DRAFT_508690 [Neocallimastix californiae]|eukprot:ORY49216.1 hypothetical protein LY90DRAFT_508690 [Neocallimastix californiae]